MMSEDEFEREKSYQVAMHFLRQMPGKELITQKEYEKSTK